jgi:DNA-binding NarL/FixJ family response regulator
MTTIQHSIVVVDDHLLIAKAITSIVEQFPRFKVLYEVENGKKLTERFAIPGQVPDIVLLDISMPEMDGFETAAWLRQHHPAVKVVALTMQGDDASLMRMIQNGALGYLHKNIHPVELEKALLCIAENGFYYPNWATNSVLRNLLSGHAQQPVQKLTPREQEFLKYACTELTYKEIAEKMFCSPRTVESYRDMLFEKLNVKTRVALALYAVKAGLYNL